MKRDKIIEKLKVIFEGKDYDYSKVEDTDSRGYITLICPIHGEFKKRYDRVFSGSGCPHCSGKVRKTVDEFIVDARNVHRDKYDYSKVEYKNAYTKVCIVCKEHGEFWQTPTNHLSGNGCPRCKADKLASIFASNVDEFIKKARITHKDKYSYEKSVYVNNSTPLTIICPIHGEFQQAPQAHVNGHGCPICKESKLERQVRYMLDDLGIEYSYQWHLPWSKYYSLDFLIASVNLGIECQGIQHFEEGRFGNEKLSEIQERDKFKFDTCKENGINIIYYTNFEEYKDEYGCITDIEKLKECILERIGSSRSQA